MKINKTKINYIKPLEQRNEPVEYDYRETLCNNNFSISKTKLNRRHLVKARVIFNDVRLNRFKCDLIYLNKNLFIYILRKYHR